MTKTTGIKFQNIDFLPEDEAKYSEADMPVLNKIVSYNVANTVEVLIQKIDNGEINLTPEFQRDFVWDVNRASLFIDSLIIGLPIPSIFLGKTKNDESFIVIDGQQRLKTIHSFFKGKFQHNNVARKFALRNLANRKWDKKTYKELDEVAQRRFRNAVLSTTVIENIDIDNPHSINDIFYRLNTGGMALTDQEMRNCIYSGSFNTFLKELNSNRNWRNLIGGPPNKRLNDVELILRFIALYEKLDKYYKPMRDFLSKYMYENREKKGKFSSIKKIFDKTVEVISKELGREAFRPTRSLNKALCDSIMISTAKLIELNKLTSNLKQKHLQLLKDKAFVIYSSEHTTDEENLKGRIDIATKYFKE